MAKGCNNPGASRLPGCVVGQHPAVRRCDCSPRCCAGTPRADSARSGQPPGQRAAGIVDLADRHLARATRSDVLLGRYLKLIAEARRIMVVAAVTVAFCVVSAVIGEGWHLAACAGLFGGVTMAHKAASAVRRVRRPAAPRRAPAGPRVLSLRSPHKPAKTPRRSHQP
ncbi:MAG TPA: hypothetical protein VHN16_17005 [Streptosporangiaceae bacterium]|nr:hypothetical protein [Streptosporangiaceae bacterium]